MIRVRAWYITVSMDKKKKGKKVTFDDIVDVQFMYVWSYAYKQARIGIWNHLALDRIRFQKRISLIEPKLTKVLEQKLKIINKFRDSDN